MKVVLLAGGFGSRISEESQFKPKPMIELVTSRSISRSGSLTTSFITLMSLSITVMLRTR